MIEVQNLTKYYGDFPAVKDISFTVNAGEILGFLGPNAAGKSTTMRVLTGYLQATGGKAFVDGIDVSENPLEVRKRVGYLPENVPLYTYMRVRSYLVFVAKIKKTPKAQVNSEVESVIEKCGLTDVKRQIVGTLSRGFRQRVGLAQSLIGNPRILILDEPTIGLDPTQIIEVRKLIRKLGGEKTVLLSTHILPEVQMICDRVVIINEGVKIAEGSPDSLMYQVSDNVKINIEVAGPKSEIADLISAVPGVHSVCSTRETEISSGFEVEAGSDREVIPEISSRIVNAGYRLRQINAERLTLEDIYVRLLSADAGTRNPTTDLRPAPVDKSVGAEGNGESGESNVETDAIEEKEDN